MIVWILMAISGSTAATQTGCSSRSRSATGAAQAAAPNGPARLVMTVLAVVQMGMIVVVLLMVILILSGHNATDILQIAAAAAYAAVVHRRTNAQKCGRAVDCVDNRFQQSATLKLVSRYFSEKNSIIISIFKKVSFKAHKAGK